MTPRLATDPRMIAMGVIWDNTDTPDTDVTVPPNEHIDVPWKALGALLAPAPPEPHRLGPTLRGEYTEDTTQ